MKEKAEELTGKGMEKLKELAPEQLGQAQEAADEAEKTKAAAEDLKSKVPPRPKKPEPKAPNPRSGETELPF